jgi:hypothetical protein
MTQHDKESLDRCYQKCVKSKAKKQEERVAKLVETKAVDQIKETDLVAKPEGVTATRNNLMLEAKEKGIKNFRILNKQELIACLAHLAEPEYVKKVVDAAIIRWQSGWKKNKVSV